VAFKEMPVYLKAEIQFLKSIQGGNNEEILVSIAFAGAGYGFQRVGLRG
jgi:hypothetical protein